MRRIGLSVILLLFAQISLAEEKIKIGVSVSLSGEAATYGQDIKNAVIFANQKLGNGEFELVIEDDKCNGKDGVTIAKKFTDVDKVRAVIGFGCSGVLLSAAPVYEKAKVITIGTESSAESITKAGDFIFRTQPSDAVAARLLYDYALERYKIFGIISGESDFTQGLAKGFTLLNKSEKLKIYQENFLNTDHDIKPQLLRLKNKKIEGLFLNGQDEAAVLRLLKSSKEIGLKVPFFSAYMGASSTFLKTGGVDAEGIITADGPSLDNISNSEGKKLYQEFILQFGPMNAWDYGFASTFEAFRAITLALRSGMEPKVFLYKTKFNGIFGPYNFDSNGDIEGLSLILKQNVNGAAVPLADIK